MSIPRILDHLVMAVGSLEDGVAEFARATGAEPVPGGSHVGLGTANYLVPLIPRGWAEDSLTYFEVLGPDPEQDPALGREMLAGVDSARLQRWAVHPGDFDAVVERARAAGVDLGQVHDMSRQTPDGDLLEWRLTRARELAFGGAQPFLIDWQDSPHPSSKLREQKLREHEPLVLEQLEFFGPEPDRLASALQTLEIPAAEASVAQAPAAGFRAVIAGPAATVEVSTDSGLRGM